MVERAKVEIEATAVVLREEAAVAPAGLPAVMAENALAGALRIREILALPLDPDDVKQQRLVLDAARGSVIDFVRAAGEEFKTRRASVLEGLLEELRAKRAANDQPK